MTAACVLQVCHRIGIADKADFLWGRKADGFMELGQDLRMTVCVCRVAA
jgi:hypothetical protein